MAVETFISDGSALINAIYDRDGYMDGKYGEARNEVPPNNNRDWAMDYIIDSLVDYTVDSRETDEIPILHRMLL